MAQSISRITNLSDNPIQVFQVDGVDLTLTYSSNAKRWFVGVEGVFDGDKLTNKTELLKCYNLGFTLISVSDNDELGAYEQNAYTEQGNSDLYIIREV